MSKTLEVFVYLILMRKSLTTLEIWSDVPKQSLKIKNKKYKNSIYFKIMFKLMFICHITKTIIGDYSFMLKVKIVISGYGFEKNLNDKNYSH